MAAHSCKAAVMYDGERCAKCGAEAVVRSLRALREVVEASPTVRRQWAADPVGCLRMVIETIEGRHVRGERDEALIERAGELGEERRRS